MSSPASSFDVVLVGTELAPLVAGALLAKRGFRVLLVAQETPSPTYEPVEGVSLPRAPFSFTPASSPVARRVLAELALHQIFRRHATQIDPAFQICVPRHRFDMARDPELLEREIEREFPEVKRAVDDFLKSATQNDALLDRIFDRDLMWPPQGFLERREFGRVTAHQPFGKLGTGLDPLRELADDHPFRRVVELPARFSDGMDPDHGTGLRLIRLFNAWRSGAAVLEGGASALTDLLIESIRTHGGVVRAPEKIDAIRVKRGTVTGVRIAASGEEIGAAWVLFGSPLSRLLRLIPDRAPFEELFERTGEPVVRYYRYTLNLRLRAEGVPEGMSRDVFFLRDLSRPAFGANALHIQLDPPDDDGRQLMCAEALLPRREIEDAPDYTATLRERVLASLGELVPFLGAHLDLVDSPHDGRGAQDFVAGIGLTSAEPWTRGPHTMPVVYGFPVASGLGVCALPVRSPIKRLLLCNSQVVPGLGMEGLFTTAWSAARVVQRADSKREWMRRGRWGKLEI